MCILAYNACSWIEGKADRLLIYCGELFQLTGMVHNHRKNPFLTS